MNEREKERPFKPGSPLDEMDQASERARRKAHVYAFIFFIIIGAVFGLLKLAGFIPQAG